MKFLEVRFALFTNAQILYYGTARANAFYRIGLLKDNRGTVRAFEIIQSKRLNVLNFKYGTVRAFDFFSLKTENFRQKRG
jgi:hypothetical protein